MSRKKQTRLEKSSGILAQARASKWCYVNTENEFTFMGQAFVIPETAEEYKVLNKASETEDYTNEALMEEILVVVDMNHNITFYNQNYDFVENVAVRMKE